MKLGNHVFRYLIAAGTLVLAGGVQAVDSGAKAPAPASAARDAAATKANAQPTLDQMLGQQTLDCQPWKPDSFSASPGGGGAERVEVGPVRNG